MIVLALVLLVQRVLHVLAMHPAVLLIVLAPELAAIAVIAAGIARSAGWQPRVLAPAWWA
jgi:hypothetical protein